MALRARNTVLLFKIQDNEDEYQEPDGATDGIRIEVPQISYRPQNVDTDEVTGSLDTAAPIPGGMQVQLSFPVYIRGATRPGTAPQWGKLLKVGGWAETITKNEIAGITFSVSNGDTIADSADGLAALTAGTPIFLVSPLNPDGVELLVDTSAAGQVTVTTIAGGDPGLADEAAGGAFTIIYGVPGVAATAGTTTAVTAAAPWAATAQQYRGMPVLVSGNPADAFFSSIIDYLATRVATLADKFAAALDDDSVVAIPANVAYRPTSVAADIKAASISVNIDGIRHKFRSCRLTATLEAISAKCWKLNITVAGLFVAKDAAAVPAVTYDGTVPGVFRKSRFLLDRSKAAIRTLTFDTGANLVFPDDPNEDEGYAAPMITRRDMRVTADPQAKQVATRDLVANLRGGPAIAIHAALLGGNAEKPGARVMFNAPSVMVLGADPGNRDDLLTDQLQGKAQGADAGAFLAVF
jgi:hypothetical protein